MEEGLTALVATGGGGWRLLFRLRDLRSVPLCGAGVPTAHAGALGADVAAAPRLNPRALDRAERTCFRGCGFSGRLLLALGVRDGGPRPGGVGPP